MNKEPIISVCSDFHGNLPNNIEKSNILAICGDLSPSQKHSVGFQRQWTYNNFIPWSESLILKNIVKDVVFVAGNHDFFFEDLMNKQEEDQFRKDLPEHVHYLRDSLVEIEGIKIYGTPWSNKYGRWAYMLEEDELDEIYSKIPEGIDIVITHGPAYGYGDQILQIRNNPWDGGVDNPDMEHLGSKSLTKHLDRVRPTYVFSGHIHSGNHNIVERQVENQITKYCCVSILDEGYDIFYKPLVIKNRGNIDKILPLF